MRMAVGLHAYAGGLFGYTVPPSQQITFGFCHLDHVDQVNFMSIISVYYY